MNSGIDSPGGGVRGGISWAWPRIIAWFLICAAAVVLALSLWTPAWTADLPEPIRGTGPNTALCFILVGLGMLGSAGAPTSPTARLIPWIATVVCSIALLVFAQWSLAWSPPTYLGGLVFNQGEGAMPGAGWPGRMSQATALGMMSLAAALWLGWRAASPARAGLAQLALLFTFILGQLGLVGHLLGLVMFTSKGVAPAHLSLTTAVGLLLAAAGLFQAYRAKPWFKDFYGRRADRVVFAGSSVLMGTVLMTGAVLSIGLLSRPGLSAYEQAMSATLDSAISVFLHEARDMPGRADHIASLLMADNRDDGSRFGAYMGTREARKIEAVRLLDPDGMVGDAGVSSEPSPWGMALAQEPRIRLVWRDEWLLEYSADVAELGGRLVVRLRSDALEDLARRANFLGTPADVLICGRQGEGVFCFPDDLEPAPFRLSPEMARWDRPMGLALAGGAGVMRATDEHGHSAIMAYAPLGKTGLGVIWGVDADAYLWPLRQAMWIAIACILALSLVAAYLMHRYVRPVVKSMARTEAYLQTVLASAPDGVLTITASGQVISCNAAAEALFGKTGKECTDQAVSRFLPEWDAVLAADARDDGRPHGAGHESIALTGNGGRARVELALRAFRFERERRIVVVIRDITERKAMEAELAKVLRQTQRILESAGEGIIGLDPGGCITLANPAALRILRYEQDQLLGKGIDTLLHGGHGDTTQPTYAVRTCPIFDTLGEGKMHRMDEAVFWNGEGLPVWVEYVSAPILENERVSGAVVAFGDVTPRRVAEMQLRDSEARYRLLAEHATDMISRHSMAGIYLYVSPASRMLLDRRPQEMVGYNIYDLIHPEDLGYVRMAHQRLLRESTAQSIEFRMRRGDGGYLWVEATTRQIVNPDISQAEIIAVTRDISRRKEVEINLKHAQSVAQVGSWTLDMARFHLEWSDETYRIFGLPRGGAVSNEVFLDHVHPDDRMLQDQAWREALAGGEYDVEHRIVVGEQVKWVRERAELERDGDGGLVRAVGTVQDITELKERQEEIFASRQKLRELMAYRDQVREDERAHIAREIHDELGQYLTALRMDAALLQMGFGGDNPELAERAEAMKKLIDQTIKVVRSVASNLRPGALDLGLVSAAEWLVGEFTGRTGVPCDLRVPEEELALDDARATGVFRILQESLTNIARYARASRVEIAIRREADELILDVRDDGVGFDPGEVREKKTYGLMGIRERAIMFGGIARFDSRPGEGTSLRVNIPLGSVRES